MKITRQALYFVLNLIVIAALGWWFLAECNSDMLFMMQGRSFFVEGWQMFSQCMTLPGGLLEYCGRYLTQLFYEPGKGTALLIVIWAVTFGTMKYAFRTPWAWTSLLLIPIVCQLAGIIDLGYWIYYLKQPGFLVRESLGMLAAALLVLGCRISANRYFSIAWAVLVSLTYPLFGYMSLVALLSIAVIRIRQIAVPITAVALTLFVPLLAYRFLFTSTPLYLAWTAGLPYFVAEDVVSYKFEIPYIIVALSFLLLPMVTQLKAHRIFSPVLQILILVASAYALHTVNFDDYNFHAECRMYRAVDEGKWEEALRPMHNIPNDATREMVMFKNIALMNLGRAGNEMFHYNNMGRMPYVTDSLHVHMVQTAAPLIYLHHGKTNFSYRWCIENSVEYDNNFNEMKVMVLASIANGEYDVAKKYLSLLQSSMYYAEWANHYMPLVCAEKNIKEYPELANIIELRAHMGSVLDGDNGLCEMYLIKYFSNTQNIDSKYLAEMTLMYAIIQKDIQLFWPHFFIYANQHQNEKMPIHYQEAAYLYGVLEPQSMDTRNMPFDKEKVIDRYNSFNATTQNYLRSGMSVEDIGRLTKPVFGDTFYWFYFFCRDVHSY